MAIKKRENLRNLQIQTWRLAWARHSSSSRTLAGAPRHLLFSLGSFYEGRLPFPTNKRKIKMASRRMSFLPLPPAFPRKNVGRNGNSLASTQILVYFKVNDPGVVMGTGKSSGKEKITDGCVSLCIPTPPHPYIGFFFISFQLHL